ncbi:MAG: lipid-binding SYLF domain-containing protein [Rhodanobacter sp.]|jgi:lipid-binding SYLF domain-containing protein|nr:lipid-binding SYLF domain-containing protein [Rhodanobacter sp.]
MRRAAILIAVILCAATAAHAGGAEQTYAQDAARVLKAVMTAPDKTILKDLLREAQAVAVVPEIVKTGLMLDGRYGTGLISVKMRDGHWSAPSFLSLTSGGIGFQAGISSTDVILVLRTERGVETIAHGKLTLGADASVAAGPVDRSTQAIPDAPLKAEILSYTRAHGLFVGAALDGTALTIDNDANQAVYGQGATPRHIFDGGVHDVPTVMADFRDRLEEYTAP